MNTKRIITFVLVAMLPAAAIVGTAQAGIIPESPPSLWNPRSFGFSATGDYFTSNANHDDTRGSFTKLASSNSFTNFETRARARYAIIPSLSTFAGVGFAQSRATDTANEKTNTNITEGFIGADFQMIRRWWRIIPEVEFSFPTDATKKAQVAPLTSDGVWFGRAGVFMFKPYKYFRFESYLGFHYPGEGLAKRFMYSLFAETAFASGFSIGGGVAGTETLLADEKTAAERGITQTSADAGSKKFWAYNPALLDARGWVGFRADKSFAFRLGYAKSLNGVRSAEGQSLLLSVSYNSPGDKAEGRRLREFDQKRADANFKTDLERNDPELFQNQDDDAEPQKPKKKDSLDDTERLLENRAQ